jgi:hypothetical protein
MQFDRGYLSACFVTNADKMLCEYENPHVLLFEKKLSTLQPILPLLEAVVQSGNPLLIVAEEIEGEVLATPVVNKLRGGLKAAAVKAPGFGDRRKAMLEHLAVLTGGQIISEDLGIKLENVTLDLLGTAKRVRLDKDSTTVIDGAGKKADIAARCTQLRVQIEETTSDYDKERLQERLAKLAGGVAIIRVGGSTEIEAKERKDRVDDAMHATRAAVEEGVIAGGDAALLYASRSLGGLNPVNDDQKAGIEIVRRALQTPARQIFDNAGVEGSIIVGKLLEKGEADYGFRCPERRLCRHGESRHYRPDEGRALGLAGRRIRCRSAYHNRGDDRRQGAGRRAHIANQRSGWDGLLNRPDAHCRDRTDNLKSYRVVPMGRWSRRAEVHWLTCGRDRGGPTVARATACAAALAAPACAGRGMITGLAPTTGILR